jgi:ankyrin repeat protein
MKEAIQLLNNNSELFNIQLSDPQGRKYDLFRIAAMQNSTELLSLLLSNKIPYNAEIDPWSAAHHCSFSNSPEVLTLLIQNGIEFDNFDERGKSPFYWSILKKKFAISKILLDNGVDVNVRWKLDQTMALIHHESKDGRIEGLTFLLENGADPNSRDNRFAKDSTPIHGACKFDRLKAAELLIKFNADVNAQNSEGKTALDFANESKKKLCKELVEKNGGISGSGGK